MVLDDEARKRLGVGLDQVISGTVGALITDLGGGASHYELDMQRARLTIDGLGWSKGIGSRRPCRSTCCQPRTGTQSRASS